MDNLRINVMELHTSINNIKQTRASLSNISSVVSSVDISGSDLSTKGNVPIAANAVKEAMNDVTAIERNLNNTKSLLIKNNKEVADLFNYLEEYDKNSNELDNIEEDTDIEEATMTEEEAMAQQELLFSIVDYYDEALDDYHNQMADLSTEITKKQKRIDEITWGLSRSNTAIPTLEAEKETLQAEVDAANEKYAQILKDASSIKQIKDLYFSNACSLYQYYDDYESVVTAGNSATTYVNEYDPRVEAYTLKFYDNSGKEVNLTDFEKARFFKENNIDYNKEILIDIPTSKKIEYYYNAYSYLDKSEIDLMTYLNNSGYKDKLAKFDNYAIDKANERHGLEIAKEVDAKIQACYDKVGTMVIDHFTDYDEVVEYTSADAYMDTLSILTKEGFVDGLKTFASGIDNFFYADGKNSVQDYKTMYLVNLLQTRFGQEGIDGLVNGSRKKTFKEIFATGTYEISTSIGNMAPSMFVSMIPGMQSVGLGLMGVSAAGNARNEGLKRGLSEGGAWVYGVLNGMSEAGLQYVLGGIAGLSSGKSALAISEATGLSQFLSGMLSEGVEESLQSVLEPLFLTIGSGGTIPYEVNWNEVFKSGIYGIITAGIMNTAGSGIGIVVDGINYEISANQAEQLVERFNDPNIDLTDPQIKSQLIEELHAMDPSSVETAQDTINDNEAAEKSEAVDPLEDTVELFPSEIREAAENNSINDQETLETDPLEDTVEIFPSEIREAAEISDYTDSDFDFDIEPVAQADEIIEDIDNNDPWNADDWDSVPEVIHLEKPAEITHDTVSKYIAEASIDDNIEFLKDSEVKGIIINEYSKDEYSDFIKHDYTGELAESLFDEEGCKILQESEKLDERLDYLFTFTPTSTKENLLNTEYFCQMLLDKSSYIAHPFNKIDIKSNKHFFDYLTEHVTPSVDLRQILFYTNDAEAIYVAEKLPLSIANEYLDTFSKPAAEWLMNNRNVNLDYVSLSSFENMIDDKVTIPERLVDKKTISRFISESKSVADIRLIIEKYSIRHDTTLFNSTLNQIEQQAIEGVNSETGLMPKYEQLLQLAEELKEYETSTEAEAALKKYTTDEDLIGDLLYARYNDDELSQIIYKRNNIELSDTIIDYCFHDISYNVFSNLKELLHFQIENGLTMPTEHIEIYRDILSIDSLSVSEKVELFKMLSMQDTVEMFYEDMANARDIMNKSIADAVLNGEKIQEFKNHDLSEKYGIDVYEFDGQKFYALVKSGRVNNVRDNIGSRSFSLIGQGAINVFYSERGTTFIYEGLTKDQIMHVFPRDSYTAGNADTDNNNTKTNRVRTLMTPDELLRETGYLYNELLILKRGTIANDMDAMIGDLKPIALYCLDEITQEDIAIAKDIGVGIMLIDSSAYSTQQSQSRISNPFKYNYVESSFEISQALASRDSFTTFEEIDKLNNLINQPVNKAA